MEILQTAFEAAASVGMQRSRVIIVDAPSASTEPQVVSVDTLIKEGPAQLPFEEFRLGAGEGKRKLAFLCFSSGTTGQPKVGDMVWCAHA